MVTACLQATAVFGQTTEPAEILPLRLRILAAEDARADRPADLLPLAEGLTNADPAVQRAAIRAIGRLERPALVSQAALGFMSPHTGVRAAAAWAIAQSVSGGGHAAAARRELLARLSAETTPEVRGAIAAAIGRLPYNSAEGVAVAARDILAAAPLGPFESRDMLVGIVRGLESLARRQASVGHMTEDARRVLRQAATFGRDGAQTVPARELDAQIRRLAVAALAASGEGGGEAVRAGLDDADDQVRRLAFRAAVAAVADPGAVVARGLADAAWLVRFETLAAARRLATGPACAVVRPLLDDPSPHVVLAAIDAATTACPGEGAVIERLRGWTEPASAAPHQGVEAVAPAVSEHERSWHWRARGFAALAALDPDWARERLEAFTRDEVWQVRVAAAAAAAVLGEVETLERLATTDAADNVREAALRPLVDRRGDAAVPALIAALRRDDPQLLLAAARALATRTPRADIADRLVETLDRTTALRRETSRDIRLALLDALRQHGGRRDAARLHGLLEDFDAAVAARAADLLAAWTGEPHQARPAPLPRAPLPTLEDLRRLAAARLVLHMVSGARVELRLRPDEAPLNALRFLRLAESGYYDGLTFHRVVPGFVVQGGSPGANEYWGDGPFSRDEVGLSNLRGTVGLSTRGRDTGDAQFYVNLVDNIRLDDSYTVFAEVVQGMADVEAFLEGEVIARVEVTDADPAAASLRAPSEPLRPLPIRRWRPNTPPITRDAEAGSRAHHEVTPRDVSATMDASVPLLWFAK